jgi:hypothetical protein
MINVMVMKAPKMLIPGSAPGDVAAVARWMFT